MNARKKLGEVLIEAKKITRDQLKQALNVQAEKGGLLGEHLVDLGFVSEETVYQILSRQLKIPVISEEKFVRLTITPKVMQLIPEHFAIENVIFPIQFDDERNSLSVAMMDPTNPEIAKELKVLCKTDKIKKYLAQKSSILRAIKFYYQGESTGLFEKTEAKRNHDDTAHGFGGRPIDENTATQSRRRVPNMPVGVPSSMQRNTRSIDLSEENSFGTEQGVQALASEILESETSVTPMSALRPRSEGSSNLAKIKLEKKPISDIPPPIAHHIEEPQAMAPSHDLPLTEQDIQMDPEISQPIFFSQNKPVQRILIIDNKQQTATPAQRILQTEGFQVTAVHNHADAIQSLKNTGFDLVLVKSIYLEHLPAIREAAMAVNRNSILKTFTSLGHQIIGDPISYEDLTKTFFETIDYLISLQEFKDPAQRRFAHLVAKYARLVAQKLNMPQLAVDEVYFAAFLQDIWKNFRAFSDEEIREGEERRYIVEIFNDNKCPFQIVPILTHISEFYNGQGTPNGLSGENIPLGSRIICVVRAFEEMMRSNLVRSVREAPKVAKLLRKGAGKKYDPKCVEAFVQILEGESFLENTQAPYAQETTNQVLIVDKDPQATSLLELRLLNEGYQVQVVRDGQQALKIIETRKPAVVISDVVIPKVDGFNLCETIKSNPQTKDIIFIFTSSRSDDFNMTKGLELGAEDYQTKPVNVPFLIAKVRKLLEAKIAAQSTGKSETNQGVAGKLSQMGLVEIIQILGGGTKTACIKIQRDKGTKAELFMERGKIVRAKTDAQKGEDAFYEMMTWAEGNFSIQNDLTTTEKNINQSNDFLLLEAMRRMDEAAAGAG